LHTLVTPIGDPVRASARTAKFSGDRNRRTVLYEIRASDVRSTIALEAYPIQDIALGAGPIRCWYTRSLPRTFWRKTAELLESQYRQAQGTMRFTHTQGIEGRQTPPDRLGCPRDTLIANGSQSSQPVVPLAHVEQASKAPRHPNPDRITFCRSTASNESARRRDSRRPQARGGKRFAFPARAGRLRSLQGASGAEKVNWDRLLDSVRMRARTKNRWARAIVHSLLFPKERPGTMS